MSLDCHDFKAIDGSPPCDVAHHTDAECGCGDCYDLDPVPGAPDGLVCWPIARWLSGMPEVERRRVLELARATNERRPM